MRSESMTSKEIDMLVTERDALKAEVDHQTNMKEKNFAVLLDQQQKIRELQSELTKARELQAKVHGETTVTLAKKYDDTLLPFVALMRKELHANADKGDRSGWLSMSADSCMLEIIYHFGKLQASVKRGDAEGMAEFGADVANMCMMLLDICGVINLVQLNAHQSAPAANVIACKVDESCGQDSKGGE